MSRPEPFPERYCPAPTRIEADDYATLEDRPATRWVDRVVAYCWPDELEAVRAGDADAH